MKFRTDNSILQYLTSGAHVKAKISKKVARSSQNFSFKHLTFIPKKTWLKGNISEHQSNI